MRTHFLVCLLLATAAGPFVCAATINVPANQPTIQDAINAANPGDLVLVAPGTYTENINFLGKAITVKSSGGAKVTIIDGGKIAPVVTFNTNEGSKSVLNGFTVQNGTSTFNSSYDGGGIYISGASPIVRNNIIQNNVACSEGGGIAVEFSSAQIRNNTIKNNSQSGCSGGPGGGGIAVGGAGSAVIIGNKIQNNSWGSNGGGITLWAAGTPTIENNVISGNSSNGGQGGGIYIVNDSNALIVQNLFYANTGSQGGAIYLSMPSGSTGPVLVNNTIVGGTGATTQGAAVWAGGFDNQVLFYNNLLVGLTGENAVFCDSTYSTLPPVFTNNDAYSPSGTGLMGTCASEEGTTGNISADPLFVNATKNNYQLQSGSPVINVGDNSAPDILQKDLLGKPRIVGGIIDMGAYEFQ
ncbi:MAG TPA: right-handed parallel beta-helix repeat-containing protein [Candidatus Dormibacteraeota bacterium]|nr:right-handed parallel beta-helix repeat-containing protein [Candidatus Dormibacteraeota bacterium]